MMRGDNMNVHSPLPHYLICVDPARTGQVWPLVRDMIDEGYAATGEITPPDLPEWLAAGKGQLWLSVEDGEIVAALTTSIVPMRNGLALRMICCGGSRMELWKSCHAQIEQFARAEGCDRVLSEGRPGWSRALKIGGYHVMRVTLEKRL
jgi:hypothetical protein